jgi:hypothetical protein
VLRHLKLLIVNVPIISFFLKNYLVHTVTLALWEGEVKMRNKLECQFSISWGPGELCKDRELITKCCWITGAYPTAQGLKKHLQGASSHTEPKVALTLIKGDVGMHSSAYKSTERAQNMTLKINWENVCPQGN